MTSRWRALPDFVIIGAPRCGTTTLFRYLGSHPRVLAPYTQEVHFFTRSHVFEEGPHRYQAYFPLRSQLQGNAITGEGTSVYMFRPNVPERMKSEIPEVKLIAVLRDPVDRAIASWEHFTGREEERRPLVAAIRQEIEELGGAGAVRPPDPHEVPEDEVHFAHVHKGRYADQLEKWFSVFPRERIHVIKSESLFTEAEATYAAVLEFLKLPHAQLTAALDPGHYPNPPGSVEARPLLKNYFREPNRRLAELMAWEDVWEY